MSARAQKLHLDIGFDEALDRYAGADPREIPPVPKRKPPRGKKRKPPAATHHRRLVRVRRVTHDRRLMRQCPRTCSSLKRRTR